MKTILQLSLITGLFVFVCSAVYGQQVNPNMLPPCPVLSDYSIKTKGPEVSKDVYSVWGKCWGSALMNGEHGIWGYVGEWVDGLPHGTGEIKFQNGGNFSGNIEKGKGKGLGRYIYDHGDVYVGEFRDGKFHGLGKLIKKNGKVFEGQWENDNFIREVEINPPNPNTIIATNTDRSEIDREGQYGFLNRFVWPTKGKVIRSFDPTSKGIDIAGKIGQPVVAASDGKVLYAKTMRGYGNLIILEHSDSVVTAYAHNKTILVREGQMVAQMQQIAEMGDSDTDAVKLQFQIRRMGKPIDPLTILPLPDSPVVSQNENKVQGLVEDQRSPANKKIQREQQRQNQRVNLQVTHTQPAADGSFTINVQTNTDTASLLVNGSEEGGRLDGTYSIKRIARAGQDTRFDIEAKDIYGNTDTKTITVSRSIVDSTPQFANLDPSKIKTRSKSDAVAIIIGIQNYRRVPMAEYANDDARVFYDYAIRALGIRPENIKLLIDDQADEIEILGTFQNWLPLKVKKSKTDVYVFYSGHGLPSEDGKSLYILPFGADKQFIDRTAINQQEIIRSLQSVQAKSVTMFLDACYSGQIRTGDTLIASARPVSLKTSNNLFPPEFTVFSASSPDQIASSSPALKHGIFSYYVMKGMEGDADENKDGQITIDELHAYLAEMVGKQALSLNRKQSPQLIGTSGKILINR